MCELNGGGEALINDRDTKPGAPCGFPVSGVWAQGDCIPIKGHLRGLCRGPRGKWVKSFLFNRPAFIITDIRKNLNWPIKPMNLRMLFSVGGWGCWVWGFFFSYFKDKY